VSLGKGVKSWSNKQLCLVFIICLPLFMLFNWDVEAWVKSKVDAAIVQNHLDISYQTFSLHGAGLHLSHVCLGASNLPKPLWLDEVELQLDWLLLWQMRLSILADVKNNFMQMKALLSMDDGSLLLSDITGQMDVQAAQAWYGKALLAQGFGDVHWQGDIGLNVNTGLPVQTDLHIRWQNAALSMMQQRYALGDYVLALKQSDKNQSWILEGGKQLQIKGRGTLEMNHIDVLKWLLQGKIYAQADAASPLAAFLPQVGKDIKLTGSLGKPQWLM